MINKPKSKSDTSCHPEERSDEGSLNLFKILLTKKSGINPEILLRQLADQD